MSTPTATASKIPIEDLPPHFQPLAKNAITFCSAQITMSAQAEQAFHHLANPEKFHEWNSFAPKAEVVRVEASQDGDKDTKYVPQVPIKKGDQVNLHVRMKPSDTSLKNSNLVVRDITSYQPSSGKESEQKPTEFFNAAKGPVYRLEWGAARLGLQAERIMEIEKVTREDGGDECIFRTWEMMTGPLAYAVKFLFGTALQERFFDWATDLKRHSEKA